MLGLPAALSPLGLFYGTMLLLAIWWFTWMTARFLAEAALQAHRERGEFLNFFSLTTHFFGPALGGICSCLYAALLFSLLCAYFSIVLGWIGWSIFLFCAFLGRLLFVKPESVYRINSWASMGLVGSFLFLVGFFLYHQHLEFGALLGKEIPLFWFLDWSVFSFALTSFGFHIVVPSLIRLHQGQAASVERSIFWGSFAPLVVYLFWVVLIGSFLSQQQLYDSFEQELLPMITFSSAFYFFAIITSLLGVVLSLFDFLIDLPQLRGCSFRKGGAALVVAFLPLCLILGKTSVFYTALRYGGFFISLLSGLLPCLMVQRQQGHTWRWRVVFGCSLFLMITPFL